MRWPFNGSAARATASLNPPLPPRLAPNKAREAVYKAITEMSEAGALDAGNGDVLDAWLDRLRPQWLAHQTMAGADLEADAQRVAGERAAAAAAARRRAEAAAGRRDHTQRLLNVFEQRLVAPTEAAPMDHPDRRRRPRPGLDSLEGLTHQWTWRIISLVLLGLAAAGDFVNFWTVVAGLTGESGTLLWILTGAFAAAAVGLMHVAGRTARNLREGLGGLGRAALTVLVTGWTALGVAAFYVRMQVTSTDAATAGSVFGDTSTVAEGPDPLVSAILLAALYVAAGLLAFFIGFGDHHPRMAAYLRLRKDLRKHQEEAASAEQKALAAERLSENARAELERTRARIAAAEVSIDAEIAELKELARVHVAGLLGDPAATNNLITGRGTAPASEAATVRQPVPVANGHPANGAPVLNGKARP